MQKVTQIVRIWRVSIQVRVRSRHGVPPNPHFFPNRRRKGTESSMTIEELGNDTKDRCDLCDIDIHSHRWSDLLLHCPVGSL